MTHKPRLAASAVLDGALIASVLVAVVVVVSELVG